MKEIWKDIKGYEGLYQVSNFGNVKSIVYKNQWGTFKRDHVLSQLEVEGGYLQVHLYKNRRGVQRAVHRLVAEAFCEKKDEEHEVNHIDYNRKNNLFSNLEWCSHTDNVRHSIQNRPKKNKVKIVQGKNKTGESHITRNGKKYKVIIRRKYYGTFPTTEAAVSARNAILEQEGV